MGEKLGLLVGNTLVGAAAISFRGFVLSLLWKWFMVATFAVAGLSVPAAIGVVLITNFVLGNIARKEKSDTTFAEVMGQSLAMSVVVLLLGYFISLFM